LKVEGLKVEGLKVEDYNLPAFQRSNLPTSRNMPTQYYSVE
jgi:hypothetical protein